MLKWAKERYWVSVAIAAGLPSVLAGIVEYVWTKGVSGLAPIAFALIGGLGAMAVLRFVQEREPLQLTVVHEHSQTPHPPESHRPPASLLAGKDFSPRSPAELVASVEGLTEIAAERASKRHMGLWLEVEGSVLDVSSLPFDSTISVHLKESKDEATLFLDFNSSRWARLLSSLDVGDRISAIGEIESISRHGSISLKKCELFNQRT